MYNVKDLQGDIRTQFFYKNSDGKKSKNKIYRNHDSNQFVGVPVELRADDPKGLHLTAKMILDTQLGRDTYVESKFVNNGFRIRLFDWWLGYEARQENKSIVTEYKLSEISVLTMEQANVQRW